MQIYFGYAGVYLVFACLFYYAFYAAAVDFNFRPGSEHPMRLLITDFFGIHCPWSWRRAVRFRVEEAHRLLQYQAHEKGWKAEDCHEPEKHEQIARDCFMSRSRFWSVEFLNLLSCPLRFALMCLYPVVMIVAWLWSLLPSFVRMEE